MILAPGLEVEYSSSSGWTMRQERPKKPTEENPNPGVVTRTTYHGTLIQALQHAADVNTMYMTSFAQLADIMNQFTQQLTLALSDGKYPRALPSVVEPVVVEATGPTMTALATSKGYTYDAMVGVGWSDEQMREQGYLV